MKWTNEFLNSEFRKLSFLDDESQGLCVIKMGYEGDQDAKTNRQSKAELLGVEVKPLH